WIGLGSLGLGLWALFFVLCSWFLELWSLVLDRYVKDQRPKTQDQSPRTKIKEQRSKNLLFHPYPITQLLDVARRHLFICGNARPDLNQVAFCLTGLHHPLLSVSILDNVQTTHARFCHDGTSGNEHSRLSALLQFSHGRKLPRLQRATAVLNLSFDRQRARSRRHVRRNARHTPAEIPIGPRARRDRH